MRLIKHDLNYIDAIMQGTSHPDIRGILNMTDEMVSREGTTKFVLEMIDDNDRTQYSRYILDDNDDFIGMITLRGINRVDKMAAMGTWIYPWRWGEGYNTKAKDEILNIAFSDLNLDAVIFNVKERNVRSNKAQAKLPYVTMNVGDLYPERVIETAQTILEPFTMNIVYKDDFANYFANKQQSKIAVM